MRSSSRSINPASTVLLLLTVSSFTCLVHGQMPESGVTDLLKSNSSITLSQLNVGQEPPAVTAPAPITQKLMIGAAGPWGQLESYPVFLEAADPLIERFPLPNSRTRWAFPKSSLAQLPEFFKSAGLSPEFIAALMEPSSVVETETAVYLFPPQPMLEAMSPVQRGVVYAELRKLPLNEFHAEPVLIPSGDVDTWFRHSELKPEHLARIKQMSYMRGDTLAFSDLASLVAHASGEAEARMILKSCTRTRGYVVSLRINATSDINSIVDYWTTGLNLRRKDIEPLLLSVKETEGAERIDLTHILPPLPRKLLLSYPDIAMAKDGILPDCHWTSLNFFNYDAQGYLLDSRLATSAVLERFNPVKAPYRYGDILFFLDIKTGDAFHSCVYLADDFVFSKNGRNILSPWVVTTLSDLKKIYLVDGTGRIQGYRNKKSPFPADQTR